ncbi:hypothetical protein EJ05DRAFT_540227 [Pseudovirgaria hyperparasitica]|uniref:EF-hand n=1 Tax=Pseudovirgaria hyperparasitica TaxID=470096 RepID=A0A6A6W0J4_9PEZI|nr:uncharacterized protein EJ05DRAFT_540227 [Pseudovirgaria hyperparasitica]KAF2755504.1 hypothetical protein EJ05DRAFT_540227 [Pseudovirgaria hyperparasitica]
MDSWKLREPTVDFQLFDDGEDGENGLDQTQGAGSRHLPRDEAQSEGCKTDPELTTSSNDLFQDTDSRAQRHGFGKNMIMDWLNSGEIKKVDSDSPTQDQILRDLGAIEQRRRASSEAAGPMNHASSPELPKRSSPPAEAEEAKRPRLTRDSHSWDSQYKYYNKSMAALIMNTPPSPCPSRRYRTSEPKGSDNTVRRNLFGAIGENRPQSHRRPRDPRPILHPIANNPQLTRESARSPPQITPFSPSRTYNLPLTKRPCQEHLPLELHAMCKSCTTNLLSATRKHPASNPPGRLSYPRINNEWSPYKDIPLCQQAILQRWARNSGNTWIDAMYKYHEGAGCAFIDVVIRYRTESRYQRKFPGRALPRPRARKRGQDRLENQGIGKGGFGGQEGDGGGDSIMGDGEQAAVVATVVDKVESGSEDGIPKLDEEGSIEACEKLVDDTGDESDDAIDHKLVDGSASAKFSLERYFKTEMNNRDASKVGPEGQAGLMVFPVILFTAGAAAALASYYLYISSTPPTGLQRSNAVRERHRRPPAHPTRDARHERTAQPVYPEGGTEGVLERLANIDHDFVYGEVRHFNTAIPLTLRTIAPLEIRNRLTPSVLPDTVPDIDWDNVVDEVHRDFIHHFMRVEFARRPIELDELVVIFYWLLDRLVRAELIAECFSAYSGGIPDIGARLQQETTEQPGTSDHVEVVEVPETEASHRVFDDAEDDGQVLQRAVYYIAEERTKQEGVIHRGITCDQCDTRPIRGIRWRCANCADFDLCSYCEADNRHDKTHIFYKVRIPAPYLGYPRQPFTPVYPGRPEMMPNDIPREVKKKMMKEIPKMPYEELDGLWDQFTCLANAVWKEDPNGIGWAIDRKAFDTAFIPHYSLSTSTPNLIYDRVFAFYDSNGDSLIGFEEFLRAVSSVHSRSQGVRLRIAFDGYDIDGDGLVTRKDFLRLFRAYYAIQKESTRDYIAVHTESLGVAGALDTIMSSQPLASHFSEIPIPSGRRNRAPPDKNRDQFGDPVSTEAVVSETNEGVDRTQFLEYEALIGHLRGSADRSNRSNLPLERWERREFYVDVEEGYSPGAHIRGGSRLDETSSMTAADGTYTDATSNTGATSEPSKVSDDGEDSTTSHGQAGGIVQDKASSDEENTNEETTGDGPAETGTFARTSRSSSRVRFQDDVDLETRSNASTHASTSSRPAGERWGGYEVPRAEKDLGRELLYQITQQGFNELLDPLFREKEDLAMETYATQEERKKWRHLVEEHMGKPISSLNNVAILACLLGVEIFEQDFRRILHIITDKHREAYKELGPERGCLSYLDDVRDAERQLLHDNVKIIEEHTQAIAKADLDNAMESRQKVIKETWESIRKSLFSTKQLSSLEVDETVLDANILSQPLENLLASAGYEVDGTLDPLEDGYPQEPAVDQAHIAAHIADARQQVEAMTQAFEQEPHANASDYVYRDPTLPQFRPNTADDEVRASPSTPEETLMSGAIQPGLSQFSRLRLGLLQSRYAIPGESQSPIEVSPSSPGSSSYGSYFTSSAAEEAAFRAPRTAIPVVVDPRSNPLERSETAEEMIQILQSAAYMQDSSTVSTNYSREDQAAHHAAYMTAARYFRPDPEVGDRVPPAWRLDRLVLLEKHESEMRQRNGAGRITFEEFEELVRRDGDVGRLRTLWADFGVCGLSSASHFLGRRFNLIWWEGEGFKRWCERYALEREMGWS